MKLRLRPTWHTLALLTMLAAMWYAAEAQSNGAAYMLAVLAAVVALVSVVHARANLRGLRLRVRSAATVREGERARVRVEVQNTAAKPARGIEILMEGAGRGLFVDLIEPGQTRHVELPAPAQQRGTSKLRVLLRSVYPLGLYSIESTVETAGARRVHPRASGSLPLPMARPLSAQGQLSTGGQGQGVVGRGGDDFAGTREWQQGDSPRHIDWRAVARGRPLVVKTWASAAGEVVSIDWESIPLPESERGGQIARWMEECVHEGRLFELKLPSGTIAAGGGELHARRCLDALADFLAQIDESEPGGVRGATVATEPVKRRTLASFENSSHLPNGPLLLLCVALVLSFLPMVGVVALPCMVIAGLCFVWRGVLRLPAPHWTIRLLVLLSGVVLTWMSHATMRSMEAGIALLITLAGAKLLESRTPREFQILAMIGWFLCLCGIVLDNSLTRMVWCVGAFALVTLCMVRFRHSVAGLRRPVWLTTVLFAQSLPLVVLLFFVFPRGLLNLSGRFGSQSGQTGISDELDPGSLTSVALRMDRAFRVEFPDGKIPPNELRYWRCLTLWDCYGMRWRRGPRLRYSPRMEVPDKQFNITQRITLEPHGARWMPALDLPLRVDIGRELMLPEYDDAFHYGYSITAPMRYDANSNMGVRSPVELSDQHRDAALQLPDGIPKSLRDLAASWEKDARIDEDVVLNAIRFFQSRRFEYSLTPESYTGTNGLEDFMLRGKSGFCEHFAASFATMMRLAGVPSRVVVGFLGGEYLPERGHMVVRQSDAHAWVEVWLEARGWYRFDPTAQLVPERITTPVRDVADDARARAAREFGALGEFIFQTRVWWDRLSYTWHDRIVDFNREEQSDLMLDLGLASGTWWHLLGLSAGILVLGLIVVRLWLRRRAPHADPWARAWQRLCRKLARAGFPPREASEGPLAYVQRLGGAGAEVKALAELYAQGRYGAGASSAAEFLARVRRLRVTRFTRVAS